MIADLIVWVSVAFAIGFVAAWAVSADLRAWIERPKYRFLDAVQRYDRADRLPAAPQEQTKP